jgi:hypothetical protein
VWKSLFLLGLVTGAACAEHPCKQECLRQLSIWQSDASAHGETIPAATVCDDPAIVDSQSCIECEEVLNAIAEEQGVPGAPACDAVTSAS